MKSKFIAFVFISLFAASLSSCGAAQYNNRSYFYASRDDEKRIYEGYLKNGGSLSFSEWRKYFIDNDLEEFLLVRGAPDYEYDSYSSCAIDTNSNMAYKKTDNGWEELSLIDQVHPEICVTVNNGSFISFYNFESGVSIETVLEYCKSPSNLMYWTCNGFIVNSSGPDYVYSEQSYDADDCIYDNAELLAVCSDVEYYFQIYQSYTDVFTYSFSDGESFLSGRYYTISIYSDYYHIKKVRLNNFEIEYALKENGWSYYTFWMPYADSVLYITY